MFKSYKRTRGEDVNARVEDIPETRFLTCGGCGLQIDLGLMGKGGISLAKM